jgi:pimeloyl-ACP methyl ester carboxylesterase
VRTVAAADGRTLRVREAGVPDGVPVLAQHGTPLSALLYPPHVLDAEAKGIRLIAYDRPGYGGSDRHEGRAVADCAADVEAICDALGIGRFCTWGFSGGGPHALATAALLPDRCAAAAALAPVAPWGADSLDFFAGMGEQNVEEFTLTLDDPAAHREALAGAVAERLAASPEDLAEAWSTLLGPADVEVLRPAFAAFLHAGIREGIEPGGDGWFDDDIAFVRPWGFELASISVPVVHWQGRQDRMVPFGHGEWLSRAIPGVESHLSAEDGHLTLLEHRIPAVHAWLVERF